MSRIATKVLAPLVAAGALAAAAAGLLSVGPVQGQTTSPSWTLPLARDPAGCTLIVDRDRSATAGAFATIQSAVDQARPGDVVCVRSLDHQDERVSVKRSGRRGAPIVLKALGRVLTSGFVIEADDVVVTGFTVGKRPPEREDGRGMGIYLAGARLQAIGNTIVEPGGDGIGCELKAPNCNDAAIVDNTIRGADGNGINAIGDRIRIAGNDVAGSRMITAGDADGIRFFGTGIVVRGNYVHDISDRGYPEGEEPHTDCFQSFDQSRPPTIDALIENNVCFNVDHQCINVEAPTLGQSTRIVFRRNVCANNGSQAVLLRQLKQVEIRDNLFLPSILYFGVVAKLGVSDATIACNLFIGDYKSVEVDDSSRKGLTLDRNQTVASQDQVPEAEEGLAKVGCNPPSWRPKARRRAAGCRVGRAARVRRARATGPPRRVSMSCRCPQAMASTRLLPSLAAAGVP